VKGTAGGYISKFSYKEKTSFGTTKPGWIMAEYSIDRRDDVVIAKIYRSPIRRQATWSLQEIESFLMSDDDAGAGAPAAPGQV
jgi:hypothetical protein